MNTDNTAGSAAPAGPSDEGRADAWLLKVRAHLQEALRIPTMPWPDPGAHGHEATARAIHASYCALRFKVIDAIAELTATRVAITGLLADRATRGAAAPSLQGDELSHRLGAKTLRVHKKDDGLLLVTAFGRSRFLTLGERVLYRLFGVVPPIEGWKGAKE